MKRFQLLSLRLTALIASLAVLSACGSSPSSEVASSNEPAANEKTYVVKYCHSQPEDHYTHLALLEMKQYVEEQSDGRLVLELFPNGQLGGDRQLIESVQMGTLEMCNAVTASFSSSSKTAMLFDLPFLFTSDENAYKILDGEIGQMIIDQINSEASGFRVMSFGVSGLRHISNSLRPIHTPADLKGIKLRTMENPVHLETFRLMGANPAPMSIGEVYTALQQKIVDGQENPIANLYGYKFNEVQKYLSLTGHIYMPQLDIISTQFWDSLPDDLKQILEEGEVIRRDAQRKFAKEYDQKALEAIQKTTEINELTAEEVKEFRAVCAPIYEKYKQEIGAELVDHVLEAIQ